MKRLEQSTPGANCGGPIPLYLGCVVLESALSLIVGILFFLTAQQISVALRQGKPYDFRLVSLLTGGWHSRHIHWIGQHRDQRWIKRGHPWARDECCRHAPLLVYSASCSRSSYSQIFGVIINEPICFLCLFYASFTVYRTRDPWLISSPW